MSKRVDLDELERLAKATGEEFDTAGFGWWNVQELEDLGLTERPSGVEFIAVVTPWEIRRLVKELELLREMERHMRWLLDRGALTREEEPFFERLDEWERDDGSPNQN